MSRFSTIGKDGSQYVYGYDRPLQFYFLDRMVEDEFPEALVGILSPIYGSAHNLLDACDKHGITLPKQHREELLFDLPLSPIPAEASR
jgi:hypothetical protein